jgi:hypothetical protein
MEIVYQKMGISEKFSVADISIPLFGFIPNCEQWQLEGTQRFGKRSIIPFIGDSY